MSSKDVRVWVDGCWDCMHFGHANAMRQAKAMGDVLVVGCHSDEEILKNKGPTVMNNEERYQAIKACRWVDEVVMDAPYTTQLSSLDEHNIDFVVHGDDITTSADGVDAYHFVKSAGRYRECKRTEGVSTTDLVGRLLLLTKDHLNKASNASGILSRFSMEELVLFSAPTRTTKQTVVSYYDDKTHKVVNVIGGREPLPTDRVAYCDGGFDLFHVGHSAFLQCVKQQSDFVIVGIHDDQVINQVKGSNNPIMNLRERVLGVLSCQYVDQIIIGAPYSVTEAILSVVPKVHIVVHGFTESVPDLDGKDSYALPKSLGIFTAVDNPFSKLTTSQIVQRIIENRRVYEERNARKLQKAAVEAQLKEQEHQQAGH